LSGLSFAGLTGKFSLAAKKEKRHKTFCRKVVFFDLGRKKNPPPDCAISTIRRRFALQ